jgi:glutamine synthetase
MFSFRSFTRFSTGSNQISSKPAGKPSLRNFSSKKPISTPKEAIEFAKHHDAEIASFRFTDLHGTDQHIQFPIHQVDEGFFASGVAFDGSSIRGWQPINESDMLLLPEPSTTFMDPFTQHKTVTISCNVVDPITKKPYSRDPRSVAIKAVDYLRTTGIAHDCYVGPEQEFFIFDKIAYKVTPLHSSFQIQSSESTSTSSELHSGSYKIRKKEGYFPVRPWDQMMDIRSEIILECDKLGMQVERGHHEVAAPGQGEINYKYAHLIKAAENVQLFKYITRNVAKKYDKIATFM